MKASLEGFACILSKVIPVAETYPLDQKPELDLLWTGLSALEPDSGHLSGRHGTSHERSMASSSGVLTGLAM
jgi:hypothetical protein